MGLVLYRLIPPIVRLAQTGFVILTWEAGPDHPNAEVVVKINSSPDIPVVKQAKSGLQITVERGRTYAYFLKDTGKNLSTVGFIVP